MNAYRPIPSEIPLNYFAHAHPHLDASPVDAYYLAGLAIPDWLGVIARRTKCRTKHAEPYFEDADLRIASLAQGVARHHADDLWFHETRAFTELSLRFSHRIKQLLGDEKNMRPWFLGHILVELLLDAKLIAETPERLDHYYQTMSTLDGELVAQSLEQMTGKSIPRVAEFIEKYIAIRFLADYADDERLRYRLNQVMQRVGLAQLPPEFEQLLPECRNAISTADFELEGRER